MNKITIACTAFFLCLLSSCNPKLIPLQGNYPQTPIVFTSDKSFDVVWDHLVDFFAQKGYSIKIIDRSSGLIVASTTSMDATYENKKGVLISKNAIVVVPHYNTVDPTSKYTPKPDVIGDWNVRLKSVDGKTSININLVNLQIGSSASSGYYAKTTAVTYHSTEGRTTGVFEKMLFESIK